MHTSKSGGASEAPGASLAAAASAAASPQRSSAATQGASRAASALALTFAAAKETQPASPAFGLHSARTSGRARHPARATHRR